MTSVYCNRDMQEVPGDYSVWQAAYLTNCMVGIAPILQLEGSDKCQRPQPSFSFVQYTLMHPSPQQPNPTQPNPHFVAELHYLSIYATQYAKSTSLKLVPTIMSYCFTLPPVTLQQFYLETSVAILVINDGFCCTKKLSLCYKTTMYLQYHDQWSLLEPLLGPCTRLYHRMSKLAAPAHGNEITRF